MHKHNNQHHDNRDNDDHEQLMMKLVLSIWQQVIGKARQHTSSCFSFENLHGSPPGEDGDDHNHDHHEEHDHYDDNDDYDDEATFQQHLKLSRHPTLGFVSLHPSQIGDSNQYMRFIIIVIVVVIMKIIIIVIRHWTAT